MEDITVDEIDILEDEDVSVEDDLENEEISVDEIMAVEETEALVSTVTYDDTALIEILTEIRGDMRILVLFAILTFCSSCLRAWRNTVIKGVR